MSDQKFIHVADVHLDSPLANLKRVDEAVAERMQQATRQSLENVAALAMEHEVAAVAIAGDLFDGPVKDASAGLWVESLFKRLNRAGIQVVLIRGNHDAVSNACKVSNCSKHVHELSSQRPETFILDKAGIAFHGQSFGARAQTQDLAAAYPDPKMGLCNVGLLHTSLSQPGTHDTYAPTTIATLENRGYEYWALGHIHVRSQQSLSEKCYIGYSGNTQGRHIRETGAKGCHLVSVLDGKIASVEFLPTDMLRWEEMRVDITGLEHLRDIEDRVADQAIPLYESADGLPLAMRIQLVGSTTLHAELTRSGCVDRLSESTARRLREVGNIWVESVKIASEPFLEKRTTDVLQPIKYLSRVAEECRSDKFLRSELEDSLEELFKKARRDLSEYGLPIAKGDALDEELNHYIRQAEDMLVARLVGGEQDA